MHWLFFGYRGRISRGVYILTILFWVMVIAVPLSGGIDTPRDSETRNFWVFPFVFAAGTGAVSCVHLTIKRLHDIGLTGWLTLIALIPALAAPAALVLAFWPSNPGPNRFGEGPDARPQ